MEPKVVVSKTDHSVGMKISEQATLELLGVLFSLPTDFKRPELFEFAQTLIMAFMDEYDIGFDAIDELYDSAAIKVFHELATPFAASHMFNKVMAAAQDNAD